MTDQQLIDETAAAIAEELFEARGDKPKTRELIARHLTAMLAKRLAQHEATGIPPEYICTAQQIRDLADGLRERGWEPEED